MASARDHHHKSAGSPDGPPPHVNGFGLAPHGLSSNFFANVAAAGWHEPPLRPPQPSFMDNKLERQGVLENMMPLGTSPSVKLKAGRTDPLRRQIQSRTLDAAQAAAAVAADEARSTPERSAVSDGTRAASLRAEGSSRPVTPPTPHTHTLATPVTTSPARQDPVASPRTAGVAPVAAMYPQQPAPGRASTPQQQQQQQQQSQPTPVDANFTLALSKMRYRTEVSDALRELRDAMHHDRELLDLLTGQADDSLTDELKRRLRKKIKRVKRSFKRKKTEPSDDSQTGAAAAVQEAGSLTASHSLAPSPVKPIQSSSNINARPSAPSTNFSPASAVSAARPPTMLSLQPPQLQPAAAGLTDAVPDDNLALKLDAAQSRHSSSSLSEVDHEIVANPPSAATQTPTPYANTNGKRALSETDPEVEENRKRVRSRLVRSQDYAVDESSLRNEQTGTLSPSVTTGRGPTLRLFSTRSRSNLTSPAAAPSTAVVSAAPASAAAPVTDEEAASPDVAASAASPATPGPTNLGRPPKRRPAPAPAAVSSTTITPATAPRVKLSPQKKGRSTVVAGIGRLDGRRPQTPDHDGQAVLDSQSENNDFCSACSGNGFLLCCDGCERSFHFDCADPPIDPEHHLEEPWFCQLCAGRRNGVDGAAVAKPSGLFSSLEAQLLTRNTTAFVLPRAISTFFEGVRMGADGEYQLAAQAMPKNWKRKTGYNEDGSRNNLLVQLFSDKAETRPILCSACGLSSSGTREIVPCDICPLAWHTDCMNPPMANAPRQKTPWHCPAHATHAISSLDPLRHLKIRDEGIPPSHRVRRPRLPVVVDTHVRRGVPNNGMIEIQDDAANLSGEDAWTKDDQNQQGTVYRLPASGIIADFITKAKSDQALEQELQAKERQRTERCLADVRARSQFQLHRQLHKRTLMERKIALNLLQLKRGQDAFGDLTSDSLLNLAYSLEAEAPDEIANDPKYARSSRDGAVSSERKQLELMQALIKQRLDGLGR